MKIKLFAAGLASVLALGAMSSSVFAENITPSGSENESTGSSEVEHIISESYLINIPSKINLNGGSEPNFTGTANVSASNVRLGAGSSLTVSVKSNNGSLKIVSDAITSTISYTISINNQSAVNASDMVSEYSDVFTMEAGETAHSAVPLIFSTTSFSNVKLAGEHKDTLSFKVDVVTILTSEMPFAANLYNDGQQHQLTDLRDGKQYWTAKIGDTIWMTQNLDYQAGATTIGENVYYSDGSDSIGISLVGVAADSELRHYAGGSYYNWNDAMEACPKGWELPNYDQVASLIVGKDFWSILESPFYGVRSGIAWDGDITAGYAGNFWSSTSADDTNAYNLYLADNYTENIEIYPMAKTSETAIAVRCVAE